MTTSLYTITRSSDGAVLFSCQAVSQQDCVNQALALGVPLNGANLAGQNLSGIQAINADLQGVNFAGTNLTGANLYGAALDSSNFSGATVIAANVQDASLLNTALPAGSS